MAKKGKWVHVLVALHTRERIEAIHVETGVSRQRIADEMITHGLDARDAAKDAAKSAELEVRNGKN